MDDAWYCHEIEPAEESLSPKKQAEQIAKMLKEQEKQKKRFSVKTVSSQYLKAYSIAVKVV